MSQWRCPCGAVIRLAKGRGDVCWSCGRSRPAEPSAPWWVAALVVAALLAALFGAGVARFPFPR